MDVVLNEIFGFKKKNITEIITGINYLVIPGVIFIHFMHISIAVIWKICIMRSVPSHYYWQPCISKLKRAEVQINYAE